MGAAQPGDGGPGDSQASRPPEELQPHQQPDQAAPQSDAGGEVFVTRPAKQEDLGLILDTWIWGMYDGNSSLKKRLPRDKFWWLYRAVLQGILSQPGTGLCVLAVSDDPDTIVGYCAFAPNLIHWVFVKKHFQGLGLGKRLLYAVGAKHADNVVVTHQTDLSRAKLPAAWIFDPYLLLQVDHAPSSH